MTHPDELLRQQELEAAINQRSNNGSVFRLHEKNEQRMAEQASRLIQSLWRKRATVEEEKRDWILLPILIIPGIASSGLLIEHSGISNERHAGQRVWMNAAFLASSRLAKGVINEDEIEEATQRALEEQEETVVLAAAATTGDVEVTVAAASSFSQAEQVFQIRSAWLHHMSLADNMVDERPGNRVRPYHGLEGIEYLSDDSVTQVGSWVHAPVTKFLVEEMGYVKGKNLDGAPYDWRVPPRETEDRDGYLTETIQRVEKMYKDNNELPVVLLCHSMGCKMGHYFLNFCLEKKGQAWIDRHIYAYMPVGAPHGGVSLAVRAGVTGKGLNDQVDMLLEGDDEGLVLYRSWGSGAWLMPRLLPPHVVPSAIVRREGELAVRVISSIQVGPIFANRNKPPKELRMTIVFRGTIKAHTDFKPLMIKKDPQTGANAVPLDATISFNETFYIAVPYLGDYDTLGELNFYFEEPAGRMYQNHGEFRERFKQYTSWAPVRSMKKKASSMIRDLCKKLGTVLRVAVCAQPWRLAASQFTTASPGSAPSELASEILMCGCHGNDDPIPVRTIEYDYDAAGSYMFRGVNKLRGSDIETRPRMDQKLGTLQVKLRYAPPPMPVAGRDVATPVAAIKPGVNPTIPIECKNDKDNTGLNKVVYDTWDGHDLLKHDGFCTPIWKLLQDFYEGDPLGPTKRSALEAPPVKRVRSIYGINRPTEVCAVYKHRPVVVVGDDMADSRYVLDTSATFPAMDDEVVQRNQWARCFLSDYKMDRGRICETPKTLQRVPGKVEQRRCCGDGTVPYWNLVHCLEWKDQVRDLTIDELNQAEHRAILADRRFHLLLKHYCKVRDPRAAAMLTLRDQHRNRYKQMNQPGAGGISTLQSALRDLSADS